jgi:3-dehydroquinate synthase
VGHALEAVSGYRWLHGQAVACGMAVEAEIAERLGLFSREAADRLLGLLRRLGLPVDFAALQVEARAVLELTALDKKARRGRARYVLPDILGKMATGAGGQFGIEVEDDIVLEALGLRGARN